MNPSHFILFKLNQNENHRVSSGRRKTPSITKHHIFVRLQRKKNYSFRVHYSCKSKPKKTLRKLISTLPVVTIMIIPLTFLLAIVKHPFKQYELIMTMIIISFYFESIFKKSSERKKDELKIHNRIAIIISTIYFRK